MVISIFENHHQGLYKHFKNHLRVNSHTLLVHIIQVFSGKARSTFHLLTFALALVESLFLVVETPFFVKFICVLLLLTSESLLLEFCLPSGHQTTYMAWLVVSTPLKNMKVSWDYFAQYMEK